MRYALTLLLGVLFVVVAGIALGFITINFSASEPQLAAGSAVGYYECNDDECWWVEEWDESLIEDWSGEESGWSTTYEESGSGSYFYDEESGSGSLMLELDESEGVWSDIELEYWDDDYANESDYWGEYDGSGAWSAWEDEWVEEKVEDPWYVSAFPGIGEMAHQMIPGAQTITAPHYSMPAPRPSASPAPAPRPQYPQPSCWLSAKPPSVARDGTSVLEWQTYHATRAVLSDFGEVSEAGTRTVASIQKDRTYVLNVVGLGGGGSCFARIALEKGEPPSCIISANPGTIRKGYSASLAWGSERASSASLSGVGRVPVKGGRHVSPPQTAEYLLTVSDAYGRSGTCATRVNVLP